MTILYEYRLIKLYVGDGRYNLTTITINVIAMHNSKVRRIRHERRVMTNIISGKVRDNAQPRVIKSRRQARRETR